MKTIFLLLFSLFILNAQTKTLIDEGGPGGGEPGGGPVDEMEAPFASIVVTNIAVNKLRITPTLYPGRTPLNNFKFSITGKGTYTISGLDPIASELQQGNSVTLDLSSYGISLTNGTTYSFYIWNFGPGVEGASNYDSFLYDTSLRNDKEYVYSGGKLIQVKDHKTLVGENTNTHYTYDVNGNMTKDENRDISNVAYNHMNLPTQLTKGSTTVQYKYNAAGERIEKTVGSVKTYYIRDASGRLIAEIESNKFKNVPIYGAGDEKIGQELYTSSGTSKGNFYHLKDHLGNIRTTINNSGTVVSAQDYYPYGQVMSGRTYTSSSHTHTENKHLYQQKERDIETDPEHNPSTGTYGESGGLDYFEARFYDSEIARFTTVDPHGNRYTHINGYASMNNNPINMIDPTGMDYIFGQHTPGEFEIQNAITLKDEEYEAMGMQGLEMSRIDIVNDDGEIISSTNVNDGKFDIITYGPLGVPIIQRNALNHQQHIADLVREYGYDAVNEKYYGEPSLGLHGPQGIQPLLFGFDFIFEGIDDTMADMLGELGASEYVVASMKILLSAKRGKIRIKRIKKLIRELSKDAAKNNPLNQKKVDQLRRIVEKVGGRVRVDANGVKGTGVKPHVQIEGLGGKIKSRHIWTLPGVK